MKKVKQNKIGNYYSKPVNSAASLPASSMGGTRTGTGTTPKTHHTRQGYPILPSSIHIVQATPPPLLPMEQVWPLTQIFQIAFLFEIIDFL